jgi:hypothetical protein
MDSILHKCLETVESAQLPEGDFLKACNALKKAFENTEDEFRVVPLNYKVNMLNDANQSKKFDAISVTLKRHTHSRDIWIAQSYKIRNFTAKKSTEFEVKRENSDSLFTTLLYTHRPHTVSIQSSYGDYVLDREEYMRSRYSEQKFVEGVTGEEDDDFIGNFDYDNFYNWAGTRINAMLGSEQNLA